MLGRIALRMAVVEALKGQTLVGHNVLDSEIGVISTDANGKVTSEQSSPFIAVYTDTGETEAEGLRGLIGSSRCDLVIETGVAGTMIQRTDAGDEEVSGFPATDAAFELMLDLVIRQIVEALSDHTHPWALLFQALVRDVGKAVRQRVGHHQLGTRLAAQELRIPLYLVEEPERGVVLDPDGAFGMWLSLLPSEPDESDLDRSRTMSTIRDYLLALQGSEVEEWEMARQRLGLSVAEITALGVGPAEEIDRVILSHSGGGSAEFVP